MARKNEAQARPGPQWTCRKEMLPPPTVGLQFTSTRQRVQSRWTQRTLSVEEIAAIFDAEVVAPDTRYSCGAKA
jgi:hypothetical protein